ncbi:MAG: hypothetical protein Q4D51_10625 [Eubacteriales bacterium]|nr:hypothetical protein [Eubacteriales bacterium]
MKKRFCIIFGILGILFAGLFVFAYRYIGTYNILSTAKGLFEVTISDNKYSQINEQPKIVIAKLDVDLCEYMNNLSYEIEFDSFEELQNQKLFFFNVSDGQEIVEVKKNDNFQIWKWR